MKYCGEREESEFGKRHVDWVLFAHREQVAAKRGVCKPSGGRITAEHNQTKGRIQGG